MTRNQDRKQREALAQEGQVAGEVGPTVVVDDTCVGAKTIDFQKSDCLCSVHSSILLLCCPLYAVMNKIASFLGRCLTTPKRRIAPWEQLLPTDECLVLVLLICVYKNCQYPTDVGYSWRYLLAKAERR